MLAPAVKGHGQPGPDQAALEKLPKAQLIAVVLEQREDTRIRLEEKDQQIAQLREQLAKWQGELEKEKTGQKLKAINQHVNQPTSKKPEWDKDGNPKPAPRAKRRKCTKTKGEKSEPAAATGENPTLPPTRPI